MAEKASFFTGVCSTPKVQFSPSEVCSSKGTMVSAVSFARQMLAQEPQPMQS